MLVSAGGRYDETSDYGGYGVEGCDTCVVPVMGSSSSGEANASDYQQLIQGGFLMTWANPRKSAPSYIPYHLSLDILFYQTGQSIISIPTELRGPIVLNRGGRM
jgi:hypothetical protein